MRRPALVIKESLTQLHVDTPINLPVCTGALATLLTQHWIRVPLFFLHTGVNEDLAGMLFFQQACPGAAFRWSESGAARHVVEAREFSRTGAAPIYTWFGHLNQKRTYNG